MKKILVIEDEAAIRDNILELLETENYEGIGAANGSIGIHLAQEHTPDLILCDVRMPKIDGHGVLEALRHDPITAAIPFIFLTAQADKTDLRQGMELGADDYLTKPCTSEELLRAIASRLKKQATVTGSYTAALKQASQQLNHLNYYDRLTNLPNRQLLQERFNKALQRDILRQRNPQLVQPEVNDEQFLPILYLSLDRFSRINETLGHSSSDSLIKAIARRLQNCLDSNDTIAHLSLEHFAILLTTINQKKGIGDFAQTILDVLSKPFLLKNGNEIFITASIGISLYPHNGNNIEKLLQNAHKAMNHAKNLGGNNYEFYASKFSLGASDRLALESSLSYALEREELQVYYQPQVNLQTGKIVGAEALLRWNHPERGLVSPAKFIPLAEETSLIIPIGEWVLKTACQQMKRWQNLGVPSLRVAVNLSARQFNQANLRFMVYQTLMETGLEPQYLELELTENIFLENVEIGAIRLIAFKAIGVQIAIDDFGTGYSSLSYLQHLPFDVLKIDQCFIRHINENAKNQAIVTAIIQMAHQMNLKVIAEGVETEAELAFLRQHQCNEIQGYLFSRPLSVEAFEKLLKTDKNLPIISSFN
ncbi:putative bifunctional diguanylate cyclase/phosphodiesterase [Argonema antarcticum]|uniref:putative bifunctional diguanylate cyclase/phosphodiesterase n=1 Tax=Argonema antarcticum TaxID=2942763 RepID=UPI0020136395|nr:GGDEF domain-containing response regulator [Argonema antarcticum]MCL1475922.1 EAL domain-containing protein [Argonema antarcticum A004/B2]